MPQADIGLIGLAVMGQNLALNMAEHGIRLAVYNRTATKVDEFLAGPAKGTGITGFHSLEELVGRLTRPRRVMMVKSGAAVDAFIDLLVPLLAPDISLSMAVTPSTPTPTAAPVPGRARHSVHRRWHLRRRGGGAPGTVHYAGRQSRSLAAGEEDLPGRRRPG